MVNFSRNFVLGKMNKVVDERLVPNGEYIDALNVRMGSTEGSEIGVIENTKGNSRLTTLRYIDGTTLSDDARCIGAIEDSEEEIIYWFVHDPSFTVGATGKLDLIVSYNSVRDILTYHVVSIDDGGGVNTKLNFNPEYLITGVDIVKTGNGDEALIFFTDYYNQPRFINNLRSYALPSGNIDQLNEEALLVIKKPPIAAPSIELSKTNSQENFLDERFISFAYRYKYKDGEYSAISQFSRPAFEPNPYEFSVDSFLNEGMVNFYNKAIITYNTGGPLVTGIDILFKDMSTGIIKVIEKIDKTGPDNTDVQYEFSNSKIFTILPESEILRLYDNVPLLAKAQTIMGNRLMYGNYVEGYDLLTNDNQPISLRYVVSLETNEIGLTPISDSTTSGNYTIDGSVTVNDSRMLISLADVDLVKGAAISIDFRFEHDQFSGGSPSATTQPIESTFNFVLPKDYTSVYEMATSVEFQNAVGTVTNIQPFADACNGNTFTDIFNCAVPDTLGVYTKEDSGIANDGDPIAIITSPTSNIVGFQLPAVKYVDNSGGGGADAYEYYSVNFIDASFTEVANPTSLHSNRGYEIGIVYMDEFNRSTTALVSEQNNVYVPCSASSSQNSIRVTIPKEQVPPSWATRYKFVIKPDLENYETIYSSIFFADPDSNSTYFLLEGENAQKVQTGDRLIVKADTGGATRNCLYATVLEKEPQAEDFIDVPSTVGSGNVTVPAGVYMKINANEFSTVRDDQSIIGLGKKEVTQEDTNEFALLKYTVNIKDGSNFVDYNIPAGSRIEMNFRFRRWGSGDGNNQCERRIYDLNLDLISSGDYDNFKDWWDGDKIEELLNSGSQTVGTSSGACDISNQYIETLASDDGDISQALCINFFRFYRDTTTNKLQLLIRGTRSCNGYVSKKNRSSHISANITVFRADSTMVFETEPQEAQPDLFYENHLSFPITNGFHEGNVQNQTATQAAIVDTEFFNCFSFGNGVESYKVRDSIVGKPLLLGNKTTVVAAQDYKRAERYADITYSGIFNDESNVNKLNEFNLGLLNFKALEDSFGAIYVLDGRETDVLTLQEDKISYVLSGKNLLSDAAAGGAITSIPEVLGTQIARTEKYGISFNPESYVNWGYDRFFTDVKRGAVIQLRGNSASNDQLKVISEQGMRSWFRDTFIEAFDTQKLGGYDPYMTEYVLVSNEKEIPIIDDCIDCNIRKTISFLNPSGETIGYCVNLGDAVGTSDITYEVVSINPGVQFDVSATYDGTTVNTGLTSVGGTLNVDKDKIAVERLDFSVTSTGPVVLSLNVQCPTAQTIDVIQVVVTNEWESGETMHTEYYYEDGTYVSPTTFAGVTFATGTDRPLVTRYNRVSGPKGSAAIPTDNSTVTIGANKWATDSYVWNPTNDLFRYLRSNTLYDNNSADILSLISASSIPTPVTSPLPFAYYSEFNSGSTGDYLYLIWDLRNASDLFLCYSATSAEDVCCNCPSSSGYVVDGSSLGSSTSIYTDASLSTFAPDGYYSDGSISRQLISGILQPQQSCPSCAHPCNTGNITASGDGLFTMDIDLGASNGAVVVEFTLPTPNAYPVGVNAEYNGIVYNGGSSPVYGFLQGDTNLSTWIGSSSLDCGLVANSPHAAVNKYRYDGATFVTDTLLEVLTVQNDQLQLTAASPAKFYMIIPKTSALIDQIRINMAQLCGSFSSTDVNVYCPAVLSSGNGSLSYVDASFACEAAIDQDIYYYHVNGAAGTLGLYDFVFSDENGANPLEDGFYRAPGMLSGDDWFQVENGVVIQTGSCVAGSDYKLRRCGDGTEIYAEYSGGATIVVGDFVDTIGEPTCTWEVIALLTAPVINDTINSVLAITDCSQGCGQYEAVNNDTVSHTFTYYDCGSGTPFNITLPPGYSINFQSLMDPSLPRTGLFSITWTNCP